MKENGRGMRGKEGRGRGGDEREGGSGRNGDEGRRGSKER